MLHLVTSPKRLRELWETISIAFAFRRGALLLRSPRSVERLREFMDGYAMYFRRPQAGILERAAGTLADRSYYMAEDRIDAIQRNTAFIRRCEQAVRREHAERVGTPPDETDVLFTLMFFDRGDGRGDLYGPQPVAVATLLRRYLQLDGNGTALILAPRWFHELLLHIWPETFWGRQSAPLKNASHAEMVAEAHRAGLGKAHPSTDVDLAAVLKLWDPDPLALYFELDELLETVARV